MSVLAAVASIVLDLTKQAHVVSEMARLGPLKWPGATTSTRQVDVPPPTFRDGYVIYRAPSPMRVNDVQRVTVRVADENAPLSLLSGLPGTGQISAYYRTYAHEVEVEVNFSYSFGKFAKDYGALTGLSVPVVAGALWTFFRWLRKKRQKPAQQHVEEDAPTP